MFNSLVAAIKNEGRCLIYGLIDPRTLLIRYIGKSVNGLYRPRCHKSSAHLKEKTYKNNWIKQLIYEGLSYDIVVLEDTSREEIVQAERWWIAYGRALGWPLTNLTDGGEGPLGRKISEEQRARLCGPDNPGKTPQSRASASERARKRNLERFSTEQGRKEHGVKVSARMSTQEARARQSALTRERLSTDEARKLHGERISAGMQAANCKARSSGENNPAKRPEVRAKMVAAWIQRRERERKK